MLTREVRETGLAITPRVPLVQTPQGETCQERPGGWNVTYLPSGRHMAGPFAYRLDAQGAASPLASMDWTRPADAYSDEEKRVMRRIVKEYMEELAAARNRTP